MTPQEKRRATLIANFGSWEKYQKAMKAPGAKGGKKGHTGGFAALKVQGRDEEIVKAAKAGGHAKLGKKHKKAKHVQTDLGK